MTINCYGVDCTGWEPTPFGISPDMLGYLPAFIGYEDERSAAEQINDRARNGWHATDPRWMLDDQYRLRYPGDAPLAPLYVYRLRDERIILYPHAFVAIIQKNGKFEVSRID